MIGIDVASTHVDVAALGAELPAVLHRVGNDAEGHSALADGLARLHPALVLMEATGGYEAALACALQAAGLRVAVVNPRMARDFARWSAWRPTLTIRAPAAADDASAAGASRCAERCTWRP